MRSLKRILGLCTLAIIAIGAFLIVVNSSDKTPQAIIPPTAIPTVKSYSLSEVALHDNAQSCWSAISGNVYNLTSWISQHPGGAEAILSLCGNNGTDAFIAQHGGQTQPERELQSFLIGKFQP